MPPVLSAPSTVTYCTSAPDGDVNAGGIIGYCYRDSRITINRVQVKGDLSNGGPQYEISSRLSYAGGIIGASLESVPNLGYVEGHVSSVVIEDTEVSGMNIISDSRTRQDKEDDRASGNALKAAGGIIGQATMMNVNCKDMKVENCVIRSGKGSAGGVIGEAFHQNESKVETTLEGVFHLYTVYGNPAVPIAIPDNPPGIHIAVRSLILFCRYAGIHSFQSVSRADIGIQNFCSGNITFCFPL